MNTVRFDFFSALLFFFLFLFLDIFFFEKIKNKKLKYEPGLNCPSEFSLICIHNFFQAFRTVSTPIKFRHNLFYDFFNSTCKI